MAFCKTHRRTEIQIHNYKKIFKVKNCCWPLHLHHKFLWCFSSPSWKGESTTLASNNQFFYSIKIVVVHSNKIIIYFLIIPVCSKLVSYILVIRDNKIIEQDIRSHGPEFQANSSLQANNTHKKWICMTMTSIFYKTKRLYTCYNSSFQNERTITARCE